MEQQIRIKDFTKEEFTKIKEILLEWNYEWLEYHVIESSDDKNVDVTFVLDGIGINLSEFIALIYAVCLINLTILTDLIMCNLKLKNHNVMQNTIF